MVDDRTVAAGQLGRDALLALLEPRVAAAIGAAVGAGGWNAEGCPWLATMFAYYRGRPASELVEALETYAGAASTATELADRVSARARQDAERWAETGEMPAIGAATLPFGLLRAMRGLAASGGEVQRLATGPGGDAHPAGVLARLWDGRPLPEPTRARMESAFGTGFGDVRVHTDSRGGRLADDLDARALTVGTHIAFAAGDFRPGTPSGDAVLAHELAHVVQQRGAGPAPVDAGEREADRAAQSAVGALWAGGAPGRASAGLGTSGLALQRCSRNRRPTTPTPFREEDRLPDAIAAGLAPGDADLPALRARMATLTDMPAAESAVEAAGLALWRRATARASVEGTVHDTDDRPLYWGRLLLQQELRTGTFGFTPSAAQREVLLARFERASRGMTDIGVPGPGVRRIIVSGFDTFRLDSNIRQGNPSGAAALALDGTTITDGTVTARIESVIFPVRFRDFDAGVVESVFRPQLTGPNPPWMILTMSQGSPGRYEVERWASPNRASDVDDNERIHSGSSSAPRASTTPAGTELLRTALPAAEMTSASAPSGYTITEDVYAHDAYGGDYAVTPSGGPAGRTAPMPAGATGGSGGDYLSNEVFYRTLALRTATGSAVRAGHLHLPKVAPRDYDTERAGIISTVQAIIRAALRAP